MFTIREMPKMSCTAFHNHKKRKLFANASLCFLKKHQERAKLSVKQSNSGITKLQNKLTLRFSHLEPASNVYFTDLALAIEKPQTFGLKKAKKLRMPSDYTVSLHKQKYSGSFSN